MVVVGAVQLASSEPEIMILNKVVVRIVFFSWKTFGNLPSAQCRTPLWSQRYSAGMQSPGLFGC